MFLAQLPVIISNIHIDFLPPTS